MNYRPTRNKNIIRKTTNIADGLISSVHFGPVDEDISLVFLHANGFSGLAYKSLLEPIAKSQGIHIAALDMRGHGHTKLPAKTEMFASFKVYAKDVLDWLEANNLQNIILAGHSLGASSSALAAAKNASRINKIICFDTIILPFYVRALMGFARGRKYLQNNYPLAKSAGRRREKFTSPSAAFSRYHGKGPFKEFTDIALMDYIDGGFLPDKDAIRLACSPKWEQFTYTAQSHNMLKAIINAPKASVFVYTDFVKQAKAMQKIAKKRPDIIFSYRPDLEHFFPLANTDITAEYILAAL